MTTTPTSTDPAARSSVPPTLSTPITPIEPVAPLDPDFVADCPYGPGGMLLDAILRVDRDASVVVARMPTHDELPITEHQRAHPVHHPRHVSGGLMVHVTGIVAFAHGYYVLDLRHRDGWIGYGAKINKARFVALARPGEPLEIECKATLVRRGDRNTLARYDFRFTQAGVVVYESDQTAMWINTRVGEPRA